MSRWSERRNRLRAVLSAAKCVYPGSVFDPISARIAQDLGFEVGMFAGSVASFAVLGAPDLIVLTLTEFAAQAHRICRAGGPAAAVRCGSRLRKRAQRDAHRGRAGDGRGGGVVDRGYGVAAAFR